MRQRVAGYVDGFNLYFGILQARWEPLQWLDVAGFLEGLVKPGQSLVAAKYFTSRLSGSGSKSRQQKLFLEANEVLGRCSLHYGQYQDQLRRCSSCGAEVQVPSEKMTDVNIAVELLADAHRNVFDKAILVSADSDLAPAISKVRELFPQKRVVVAFPPKRQSHLLSRVADGNFRIARKMLLQGRLPQTVEKGDGVVLECPTEWHLP